jgi:hypothetical protein
MPPLQEDDMTLTRRVWFHFVVALLSCVPVVHPATAQLAKPARTTSGVDKLTSMIWIGNSFFYYNNSMHGHFFRLVRSADPKYPLRQSSVTISGSGFGWHDIHAYFKPGGIGSYSFVGDNEVRFNKIDKLFDLALMMDCSQCPIHPILSKTFTEYAKSYSDAARKYGAIPVFFMSWAYADKPEMADELAAAYIKAANDNDAYVVPAGLAFQRSIKLRPDINLYVDDKRHPSLAGTYLGAATVYAAVMGKSPVGLTYTAGLAADIVQHLQQVAQDTVSEFLK